MNCPPSPRCALCALLIVACGPSVKEHRVVHAPPLPADCGAALIEVTLADMTRLGRYEVVGNVVFSGSALSDPFDPELLEQVRARTCAMGGRLFTLAPSSIAGWDASSEATIEYAVLRDRAW